MAIETIVAPNGTEKVIMSRADYQDLVDDRDHANALRAVVAGTLETVSDDEVDAYLQSPIGFWRRRRGLTQAEIAVRVGISQAFLSQIKAGVRSNTISVLLKLAEQLIVPLRMLSDPTKCD